MALPGNNENEDFIQTQPYPCTYEDVMAELGTVGKFHFIQLSLCTMFSLFSSFLALGFVFIGYTPPHVCKTVNETEILAKFGHDITATVSYDSCHMTVSTNQSGIKTTLDTFSCPEGRIFAGGKHLTLVSEWDLVCESVGQAEVCQALFIAGQIVGGFFTASIADRFGRKPVIVMCSLLCTVLELSISFAPNIYIIWGILFIDGVSYIGVGGAVFVLGLEYLQPKHRANFGIALCVIWVFCVLVVGAFGFIFQIIGWRYFQAAGASTGFILLLYPFFLYESPRWLAIKNRPAEALVISKRACLQNGRDFTPVKAKFEAYMRCISLKSPGTTIINTPDDVSRNVNDMKITAHYSAFHLIRHRYTLVLSIVSWYIWITNTLTYYGIYMTSSSLSGNRFVNFSVMAIVEIPSNILVLYMLKRIGRLIVLRIFLLSAAVSLFASSLFIHFSEDSQAFIVSSILLFIIGKFAIGSSFNTIYLYTPEIFPTLVRSAGFGTCKSISRIGSLIAPYFRPLFDIVPWLPGVIFSIMCCIAFIITPLLPETKDKILPTTIEEVRTIRKRKQIQV